MIAMTCHLGPQRRKGDASLCSGHGKTANPRDVFGNKTSGIGDECDATNEWLASQ